MALFGTGTGTQYWVSPFGITNAVKPITLSGWFWSSTPTVNEAGFALGNGAAVAAYTGFYRYSDGSANAGDYDGSGFAASTVAGAPTGVWFHYAIVSINQSEIQLFVNGIAGPIATGTIGAQNFIEFSIGNQTNSLLKTTSKIAECAAFSVALAASDIMQLALGTNPLALPAGRGNLIGYWPLRSNLLDYGPRRMAMQPLGGAVAVWADHPPVQQISRRRTLKATLPPIAGTLSTFSRASTATYFDGTGTLQTAPANVLRYPAGGTTPLAEPAGINYVNNSDCLGATNGVIGSGGALPTNWTTFASSGATLSVIGTGTVNGLPYVDIRISGTMSGTNYCVIAAPSATFTSRAAGQMATASGWFALVSGSLSNIASIDVEVRDGSGNYATLFTPTATLTRYAASTPQNAPASSTTVYMDFSVVCSVIGTAIDLTLRVAGAQLESPADYTTATPTSFMPSVVGSNGTRAADVFTTNASLTSSGSVYTGATLAVTETMTIAAIGRVLVAGALVATESMILAAAGGTSVTGTLAVTESMALAASGGPVVAGALATTETMTLAAVGGSVISGALAVTEAMALAAAGTVQSGIVGTLSVTEGMALTAAGSALISGTLAQTVTATLAATGRVPATASLAVTESMALTASAGAIVAGVLAVTESMALAASGGSIIIGGLAVTESMTLTASGSVLVFGALAATETATLAATGAVPLSPVTGTLAATETAALVASGAVGLSTTPLRTTRVGAEAYGLAGAPIVYATRVGAEAFGLATTPQINVTRLGVEALGNRGAAAQVNVSRVGIEVWYVYGPPKPRARAMIVG